MTQISINYATNCFNLTLSGPYGVKEALSTIEMIKDKVIDMRPGFTVINDSRSLGRVDISAAIKIHIGTKILEKHGAKRIIRVVGKSQSAAKVFGKFSSLFGSRVEVYYVETLKEANDIINSDNRE